MTKLPVLLLLIFSVLEGCVPGDDDRCPAGYRYLPRLRVCDKQPVADGGAGDRPDAGATTDSGSDDDAGAEDVDDNRPPGLGEPCTEDAQCERFQADFCAVNPLSSTGYCTFTNCAADSCPAQYLCCDCQYEAMEAVLCLSEAEAGPADEYGICTCL